MKYIGIKNYLKNITQFALCAALAFYSSLCSLDQVIFPADFLKGTAIDVYQNGGDDDGYSNWGHFENQKFYFNLTGGISPRGVSPIYKGQKVGEATGFWKNAINDVALIRALACNAFRFSVSWSEIEPQKGVLNKAKLDYFEKFVDELRKNNIKPMITLHHFTHPQWFEALGGFTKEENIPLFVNFTKTVFERLSSKVDLWCTINEPTVLGACGYVLGIHPPGKIGNFTMAGTVLKNLLNAHVAVYETLKAMPHGKKAQIGIVHQMLRAEPFDRNKASNIILGFLQEKIGAIPASFLDFIMGHEVTKTFLQTGNFRYHIPKLGIDVRDVNERAPKSYDFIGLNFYSKLILGPHPTCYAHHVMTDMPYGVQPETIYDAIAEMSTLGVPIYITENGIPDREDKNREKWIKEYLTQVHRAVIDGYDVRGYFYWTLMDNWEWNDGYSQKFGLYEVDFETQKRTLREGSKAFRDFFKLAA